MNRSRLRTPVDLSDWHSWLALVAGIAAIALILTAAASALRTAPPSRPGTLAYVTSGRGRRVLFVGNSLTYTNDLAQRVAQFAAHTPGQTPVRAYTWALAGATLNEDQTAAGFAHLLAAVHWDIVVMQEGTASGSVAYGFPAAMNADVGQMASAVRAAGAAPILFETWADRPGSDPVGFATHQGWIARNYATVGHAQGLPVAHVGDAWALALAQRPAADLWLPDGHHPAPAGSYLAAAVISSCLDDARHATATVADPQRSGDTAGLDPATAQWLRQIAAQSLVQEGCSP